MPAMLGAGVSGAGAAFAATVGSLPPLTTRAGVAGSSVTSVFSSTADLAGADEALAGFAEFVEGRELVALGEGSLSSFDGFEAVLRVMSGWDAAEGFAESTVGDPAGAVTLADAGVLALVAGAADGEDTATGCGEELLDPLR